MKFNDKIVEYLEKSIQKEKVDESTEKILGKLVYSGTHPVAFSFENNPSKDDIEDLLDSYSSVNIPNTKTKTSWVDTPKVKRDDEYYNLIGNVKFDIYFTLTETDVESEIYKTTKQG